MATSAASPSTGLYAQAIASAAAAQNHSYRTGSSGSSTDNNSLTAYGTATTTTASSSAGVAGVNSSAIVSHASSVTSRAELAGTALHAQLGRLAHRVDSLRDAVKYGKSVGSHRDTASGGTTSTKSGEALAVKHKGGPLTIHSVAIVGVSATTAHMCDLLVRGGIGGLVLVDAGSVTAADCTNAVFAPYMLGCERAEAIAHKSRGLNADCLVTEVVADLTHSGDVDTVEKALITGGVSSSAASSVSAVVCGLEDVASRRALNELCLKRRIPILDARVLGQGVLGHAQWTEPGRTPCLLCAPLEADKLRAQAVESQLVAVAASASTTATTSGGATSDRLARAQLYVGTCAATSSASTAANATSMLVRRLLQGIVGSGDSAPVYLGVSVADDSLDVTHGTVLVAPNPRCPSAACRAAQT